LAARLFLAGSFNDHIVHHLFPTLDMSRQPLLRPMVLETMREFKVGACIASSSGAAGGGSTSSARGLYRCHTSRSRFGPCSGAPSQPCTASLPRA
jgi:fatty acid desaturase